MFSMRSLVAAALVGAALLSGCASSTRLEPPAPVEDRMGGAGRSATDAARGSSSGVGSGQVSESRVTGIDNSQGRTAGEGLPGANGNGDGRTVYFDYDSYAVKEEYRGVIESNARALVAAPSRRMQAEGHTDARGSTEYNLALGQRRAEAVVKALLLLGARDQQVEAVSYGKERPAVQGDDEAAWAKNRRVELRDR